MATTTKKADTKEDQDKTEDMDTDAMHGVTKPNNSPDETVPGGRYKVGERLVNAHGEEIKK